MLIIERKTEAFMSLARRRNDRVIRPRRDDCEDRRATLSVRRLAANSNALKTAHRTGTADCKTGIIRKITLQSFSRHEHRNIERQRACGSTNRSTIHTISYPCDITKFADLTGIADIEPGHIIEATMGLNDSERDDSVAYNFNTFARSRVPPADMSNRRPLLTKSDRSEIIERPNIGMLHLNAPL